MTWREATCLICRAGPVLISRKCNGVCYWPKLAHVIRPFPEGGKSQAPAYSVSDKDPSLRLKLLWCLTQTLPILIAHITYHKSFSKICVIPTDHGWPQHCPSVCLFICLCVLAWLLLSVRPSAKIQVCWPEPYYQSKIFVCVGNLRVVAGNLANAVGRLLIYLEVLIANSF